MDADAQGIQIVCMQEGIPPRTQLISEPLYSSGMQDTVCFDGKGCSPNDSDKRERVQRRECRWRIIQALCRLQGTALGNESHLQALYKTAEHKV
jgi:hypothetical protein